jgi:hypothetical protein
MQELIPLAYGLVLGAGLGLLRPSLRLLLGVPLIIALGVLATVVTGEFRVSWSYLLIDIPLVGVASAVGILAGRRLRAATGDA